MGRTGGLAGRSAPFADGKGAGYGLGVFFKNRFSNGKPLVIFVRDFNGANFSAFPAAGAFRKINVPGLLADFCLEIARLPV